MPRRNFRELEAKMTPKQIAERDARVKEAIAEMPLNRLREARQFTQARMADVLDVDQSAISQIEKRTDMYVRTLAAFIQALGGELEIRANFADGSVRISGLLTDQTITARSSQ